MNNSKPGAKPRKLEGRAITRPSPRTAQESTPEALRARILKEAREEARAEIQIAFQGEFFSGPLPHPRALNQYNNIVPDGGNRIFVEWETQGAHDRAMEAMEHEMQLFSLGKEAEITERGQWMGFTIGVLCLLISAGLIAIGQVWVGGILGTVDIVALTAVFVNGRAPLVNTDSRVTTAKSKDE